jgi:broad specificity phosphatase PhoE
MASFKRLSDLFETHLARPGISLYFFRHGQSMANHAGSIVGWTDSKLSVKGREQANKMYRAFYPHIDKFTHIHSSDLSRCRDTLNLALGFPSKKFLLS